MTKPAPSSGTESNDYVALCLPSGGLEYVSREMMEYLRREAERRAVSVAQVYEEEKRAEQELKCIELPRDRLENAAQKDHSQHPWLRHGDEEKPF